MATRKAGGSATFNGASLGQIIDAAFDYSHEMVDETDLGDDYRQFTPVLGTGTVTVNAFIDPSDAGYDDIQGRFEVNATGSAAGVLIYVADDGKYVSQSVKPTSAPLTFNVGDLERVTYNFQAVGKPTGTLLGA